MENISQPGNNSDLHSVKIKAISTLSTTEEKSQRYISEVVDTAFNYLLLCQRSITYRGPCAGKMEDCVSVASDNERNRVAVKILMRSLRPTATCVSTIHEISQIHGHLCLNNS